MRVFLFRFERSTCHQSYDRFNTLLERSIPWSRSDSPTIPRHRRSEKNPTIIKRCNLFVLSNDLCKLSTLPQPCETGLRSLATATAWRRALSSTEMGDPLSCRGSSEPSSSSELETGCDSRRVELISISICSSNFDINNFTRASRALQCMR